MDQDVMLRTESVAMGKCRSKVSIAPVPNRASSQGGRLQAAALSRQLCRDARKSESGAALILALSSGKVRRS